MGITRQQALDCFASDDLIGIGMEADALRRSLHPENVVTYTIARLVDCSDLEKACASARKSIDMGATGLLLSDTLPQQVTLDHYESIFKGLKQRFPETQLHGVSATQILKLVAASHLSLRDIIARLRDAGLDSIAGSAVIFNDEIRKRAVPERCTTAEWVDVHRTAHQLGLPTKATMIFGVGETITDRIDHLEILRSLQQETGGFTAFTPLTAHSGVAILPPNTSEPTAVEYLTTLAVSRLYLDNIPSLQASWPTQGLKVLQMSLRFGANDVGTALLEDHLNKPGGATEEELRRIIREAGFKPVQRDALYRTMFLN
ncbi:MAG: dehypoxanthine futalosine cyclase [Acidobacteria bacterium]|nr:dehypoxanthine futalosine cyclase [Acidobacteriota bacterium]